MSDMQAETRSAPTVPPVRVRLPTIPRIAAAFAAVVAAAIAIALATQPWWLAPLVARDLAARSGRDVHFDSIRLGLTAQLAPVAVLRGVRISNAPWGDTGVPFAALDEARFEFAWRRVDGRFVISKLILRGGETHLERHPDGRRNWRLRQPDDVGAGHYWFDALEAHEASLTFRNPAIAMVFHGAATAASGPAITNRAGDAMTTHIVIDGSFRGVDYRGDLLTGPELTFRDTGRWCPVRGHAEVSGARIDVDGRVADLFLEPRIDADAMLEGRSLAAMRAIGRRPESPASQAAPTTTTSMAIPTTAVADAPRPFHVAGHVRAEPHRYALEAATATVGGTDLHGDIAWSMAGARPLLKVHLASDKTDIADLSWLAGGAKESPSAETRTSETAADPFARVRELDADFALAARHVSLAAFHPLQSVTIAAILSDGHVSTSTLDLGWAGGHTAGHVDLDLRQPTGAATVNLQTRGVHVEDLLPDADAKKRVTGLLGGTLEAKATGNGLAAWRDSVSGRASFTLHDGTISSLLDAALGLEAGKLIRTVLSGAEPLAMPCAAATVSLQQGRGTLRDLVIDSANTRTTGSGRIDLRAQSIDVVLTPEPKRPGIDVHRSIRLLGPLESPQRSLIDPVVQPAVAACPSSKP